MYWYAIQPFMSSVININWNFEVGTVDEPTQSSVILNSITLCCKLVALYFTRADWEYFRAQLALC